MKTVFGVFFIFAIGAFLGYLYSESRTTQTNETFQEANDSDHNNKVIEDKPTVTETPLTAVPKPKTAEQKLDSDLPKARILVPEAKPQITVNIAEQKRAASKSEGASQGSAYTIAVPGLTGTVKLMAQEKPQFFRVTPECRKQNGDADVPNDTILRSSTGGLANVFVSIRAGLDPKASFPIPQEPVVLDQTGCVYTPHVYAIRVGQPFHILNSDPFMHNVNGMPKLNPKFNNGMPTKGSRIEKKFTKAEDAFRIKCDVHPWMSAYVWVVEHPYFAFTDANGKFNIPNLPYGEYVLQIQHEKLGTKEKKVTWNANSLPTDFVF